ncbi:MAG: autotransporter domain-containing protein [Alphaproteobacteria bacterium]|nr:autotransporter domain-containing protein [Alphaproteobacteria bacterium]
MSGIQQKIWLGSSLILFALILLTKTSLAGHQFSQATHGLYTNSNVTFSAGQSLTVTQSQGFEAGGTNGRIELEFDSNFGAGDAVTIAIGSYSETFTFGAAPAGFVFNSSSVIGTSALLAAEGIVVSNTSSFTITAASGSFTWTGYRFGTTNGIFDGSNSSEINQATLNASNARYVPNSKVATTDGVANVLEKLSGNVSGELGNVMSNLDKLSDSEKTERMKKLTPDASGSAVQSAAVAVRGAMDSVKVRISENFSTLNSTVITKSNKIRDASHKVAQHDGDQTGMSSGNYLFNDNVWVKGFYEHANQEDVTNSKGDFAGYESDVYGASFGFDHILENNLLLGIAYSHAQADVDMTGFQTGNGTNVTAYQLTPYLAYSKNNWNFELMTGISYNEFESWRDTETTGFALADYTGIQLSAQATTSYKYWLNDYIAIAPEVGMGYDYIYTSDYRETGAGVLNLDVQSADTTRYRSILGLTFSGETEIANILLRPYIGTQWQREFQREGVNTTSSFVGGGEAFKTQGQELDRDRWSLGGGLSAHFNEISTLSLGFNFDESETFESYQGQLMYRHSIY